MLYRDSNFFSTCPYNWKAYLVVRVVFQAVMVKVNCYFKLLVTNRLVPLSVNHPITPATVRFGLSNVSAPAS